MWRERALRILLVLFGLIFVAGVYPLITSVRSGWQANKEESLPMGLRTHAKITSQVRSDRVVPRR
jgi:hypothetical protein